MKDISKIKRVTGLKLFLYRYLALFKKRWRYDLGNPMIFLMKLFFPLCCLVYGHFSHDKLFRNLMKARPALDMSLDIYDGPKKCFIEVGPGANQVLVDEYKKVLQGKCNLTEVKDLKQMVFGNGPFENYEFLTTAAIGAKFTKERTLAWANYQPAHTAPIALTAVYNAYMRATKNKTYPDLSFVSYPVEFPRIEETPYGNLLKLMLMSVFAIPVYFVLYGIIHVEDRASGSMQLQFVCGLNPASFWIVNLLIDLVTVFVSLVFFVLGFILLRGSAVGLTFCFIAMFQVTLAGLPFTYLGAMLFEETKPFVTMMSSLGLVADGLWSLSSNYFGNVGEAVANIFPYHNFASLIYRLIKERFKKTWQNHVIFAFTTTIYLGLLIMIDLKMFSFLQRLKKKEKVELGKLDSDVLAEMNKVNKMSMEEINVYSLVAKHLRKRYKDNLAVKDCTFTLSQ